MLLKEAGKTSVRTGANKTTVDHLTEVISNINGSDMKEIILRMPKNQKFVLLSIICGLENPMNEPLSNVQTFQIYEYFSKIVDLKPLSFTRFSEVIKILEQMELIESKVKGMGRGKGKSKTVDLKIGKDSILKYLKYDNDVENIITSKRCRQALQIVLGIKRAG